MSTLKKLLYLLSDDERHRALLLFVMMLVMAFLDALGVASIMPFMAVLANPSVIESNPVLADLYKFTGLDDPQAFMFFLALAVFVALLVSIAFKGITTYAQVRFAVMREYSIGSRLVQGYLNQPYEWFLNRNSSDVGKTVLSEVQQVISSALMPMLQLVAQGSVVVALVALLIVADPLLALSVTGVVFIFYISIYRLLQGYLSRLGSERLTANGERFSALSEAFGGFKEIKVSGLEEHFLRRFQQPAWLYANHQAKAQAVAQLPRFALEGMAFGGMLSVILFLMKKSGDMSEILPILALYALAGYRLMPALQMVYASISNMRFSGAALDSLHHDLKSLKAPLEIDHASGPLSLKNSISLNDVTYSYPGAAVTTLSNLSLEIAAGKKIGFVGKTGSGKTTTADVILGLLEPHAGSLSADGVVVTRQNVRQWQRLIGYVPQAIYLNDDTIAANIALGVSPAQIDQASIEFAAKIACLHDFIVNELPEGYSTAVGERGVRLSGGQRQRIGIARAIFHQPKVLVLDEATSALDNLTEQRVIEGLEQLGKDVTIIQIAHRLATVRRCDSIYLMEKGRVIDQGTYDELKERNAFFGDVVSAGIP